MSLALYDSKQSNVSTYNSTLGWFENAGEVRSKGVEAEIHSSLWDSVNLIGSYTYTDAETVNTTVAGTEGTPARIPAHMASAFASYTFPGGPLKSLTTGVGNATSAPATAMRKTPLKCRRWIVSRDGELRTGRTEQQPKAQPYSLMSDILPYEYVASCASDTAALMA